MEWNYSALEQKICQNLLILQKLGNFLNQTVIYRHGDLQLLIHLFSWGLAYQLNYSEKNYNGMPYIMCRKMWCHGALLAKGHLHGWCELYEWKKGLLRIHLTVSLLFCKGSSGIRNIKWHQPSKVNKTMVACLQIQQMQISFRFHSSLNFKGACLSKNINRNTRESWRLYISVIEILILNTACSGNYLYLNIYCIYLFREFIWSTISYDSR